MDSITLSNNKAFGSVDYELSKIRSFEKQQELFNILHSEDPDHYSRLWLAGFLKHVGYALEEICAIIDKEASWVDYDARVTYCQVKSVFRRDYSISSQFGREGSEAGREHFSKGSFPCLNGGEQCSLTNWT